MQAQATGGGEVLPAAALHGRLQQRRLDQFQQAIVEVLRGSRVFKLQLGPATHQGRNRFLRFAGLYAIEANCPCPLTADPCPLLCHRRGQMFGCDHAAAGEDHGVLDGVAQFADVAEPRPRAQLGQGLRGDRKGGDWLRRIVRGCPANMGRGDGACPLLRCFVQYVQK